MPVRWRWGGAGGGTVDPGVQFRVQPKAGVRTGARLVSKASAAVGAAVVRTVAVLLVMPQRPALRFAASAAGTIARPATRTGVRAALRGSGSNSRPSAAPAGRVTQITYSLTHRKGATGVTEEAVGGRTDFTNDANAIGSRNGTMATMAGSALGSRGGRLALSYQAFTNKTPLTITSVKLIYYFRITGAIAAEADVQLWYSLDGGATKPVAATFTQNTDGINNPWVQDITAAVGGDWSKLDQLRAYVHAAAGLGDTWVCDVDAVEVEIVASRTDTF